MNLGVSEGTATHPLLGSFVRKTVRVELVSRPDLVVHVLLLTAFEGQRYSERTKGVEGEDIVYHSLAEHVCGADGKRLLTFEQAREFTDRISGEDLRRIMVAAGQLNSLGKEALEKTEKN